MSPCEDGDTAHQSFHSDVSPVHREMMFRGSETAAIPSRGLAALDAKERCPVKFRGGAEPSLARHSLEAPANYCIPKLTR